MISSIKIEAFRGIKEGQLDGLGPITILVGPNNSGKSTCLEAIALVGLADRLTEVVELLLHRRGPPLDALGHVISARAKQADIIVSLQNSTSFTCRLRVDYGSDDQVDRALSEGLSHPMMPVTLELYGADGCLFGWRSYVDRTGRIAFTADPDQTFRPYPVRLVDVQTVGQRGTLEDAYTSIERAGRVKTVVQSLAKSMKGLVDLRILKSGQDFLLHAVFDGQPPVPVYLTGDGSKRLVELASAILGVDPDGVVLLEEPECFQHPRHLRELASLLIESAKAKRQIILSTHSIELVDLLLNAATDEGLDYPFVHRLRLIDGKLSSVVLNREQATVARQDLLEDLRA